MILKNKPIAVLMMKKTLVLRKNKTLGNLSVSLCLSLSSRSKSIPIEELWKLKYFTMQKYNLQKNPLQEIKILQDIITL